MARGKGGDRTPAKPAAVSGPGALSQRTDGGPAAAISSAGGQPYGDRAALEATEQGLASGSSSGQPGPAAGPGDQGGGQSTPLDNAFGPTNRPRQGVMTGVPMGGAGEPQLTSDQMLRMMFRKRPSPWIARMLSGGT